jgi:hypothetical protein
MPDELSAWLRAQRQARGWNVPETARQLRAAAKTSGDPVPGNKAICTYIRRWERGQIEPSERYKLHYCKAYGIPPSDYGAQPPQDHEARAADTPATAPTPAAPAGPPGALVPSLIFGPGSTGLPQPPIAVYRETKGPGVGNPVEREVLMAAHEGSEHAEQAERRDIGEATLEQLRADVVRLSLESMNGEPFPLFLEMRRVRSRIYAALERRLWPRDAAQLYLLAGSLSDLMAVAAAALGYFQAAEELIRAGWAYATVIDHRPLMAHLRLQHASVTYWDNRPRQARDLAESGLSYLANGPNAAHLHVKYAQAVARLGDSASARRAITAADDARERGQSDDVLELGGEFALSRATQHYVAGSALADVRDANDEAAAELGRAQVLFAAGPPPGEQYWFGAKALVGIDLATIRLRGGDLDAATVALGPVLSLPIGQRITAITARLTRVRAELAHPRYQGSPQARDLDERIEDFARDTITTGLHELPGTPG